MKKFCDTNDAKWVDKPKTRPYNNVIDGTQSRRIHRRLRRGVCEWCFSFFLLFIKKAADRSVAFL